MNQPDGVILNLSGQHADTVGTLPQQLLLQRLRVLMAAMDQQQGLTIHDRLMQ